MRTECIAKRTDATPSFRISYIAVHSSAMGMNGDISIFGKFYRRKVKKKQKCAENRFDSSANGML